MQNLLGIVYKSGNLVFNQVDDVLVSPVGNKVTIFDLKNNKSKTLPFEARSNIEHVVIS